MKGHESMRIGKVSICCVCSTEITYDISKIPAHLPWLAFSLPP